MKYKYIDYDQLLTMVKRKIGELRFKNKHLGTLTNVNERKISKVLKGDTECESTLLALSNAICIKVKKKYQVPNTEG